MSIFLPFTHPPSKDGYVRTLVWDGAASSSGTMTLTNGNKTARVNTGTPANIMANIGRSTGKYYFEVVTDIVSPTTAEPALGICDTPAHAYNGGAGWYGICVCTVNKYMAGAGVPLGGADFVATDILGCAVDLTAGKIWVAKNNTWYSSGDPAGGTSPLGTGISGTMYPTFLGTASGSKSQCTIRGLLADFSYTPPSGFLPWQS